MREQYILILTSTLIWVSSLLFRRYLPLKRTVRALDILIACLLIQLFMLAFFK